jgi:hypothetical protein
MIAPTADVRSGLRDIGAHVRVISPHDEASDGLPIDASGTSRARQERYSSANALRSWRSTAAAGMKRRSRPMSFACEPTGLRIR